MTIQPQNNNLNYLIDLTLIGCLFCRLKELKKTMLKKDHRDSFSHYYVPKVKVKNFNMLID